MPDKEYHRQKAKEHYVANASKYKDRDRRRRLETKRKLVALKGGECTRCGYSKCIWALELHHVDPTLKTIRFSNSRAMAWDRLVKEAELCILLCSNCHREVEYEACMVI